MSSVEAYFRPDFSYEGCGYVLKNTGKSFYHSHPSLSHVIEILRSLSKLNLAEQKAQLRVMIKKVEMCREFVQKRRVVNTDLAFSQQEEADKRILEYLETSLRIVNTEGET